MLPRPGLLECPSPLLSLHLVMHLYLEVKRPWLAFQSRVSLDFLYVLPWLICPHSSTWGKISINMKLSLSFLRSFPSFPEKPPRTPQEPTIPLNSKGPVRPLEPLLCFLFLGSLLHMGPTQDGGLPILAKETPKWTQVFPSLPWYSALDFRVQFTEFISHLRSAILLQVRIPGHVSRSHKEFHI